MSIDTSDPDYKSVFIVTIGKLLLLHKTTLQLLNGSSKADDDVTLYTKKSANCSKYSSSHRALLGRKLRNFLHPNLREETLEAPISRLIGFCRGEYSAMDSYSEEGSLHSGANEIVAAAEIIRADVGRRVMLISGLLDACDNMLELISRPSAMDSDIREGVLERVYNSTSWLNLSRYFKTNRDAAPQHDGTCTFQTISTSSEASHTDLLFEERKAEYESFLKRQCSKLVSRYQMSEDMIENADPHKAKELCSGSNSDQQPLPLFQVLDEIMGAARELYGVTNNNETVPQDTSNRLGEDRALTSSDKTCSTAKVAKVRPTSGVSSGVPQKILPPSPGWGHEQQTIMLGDGTTTTVLLEVPIENMDEVEEEKRRRELIELAKNMKELQELQQLVNNHMELQSVSLQYMDTNMQLAHDRTVSGRLNLGQAARYKIVGYVLAGAMVGAAIGGPIGLAVGAKSMGVILGASAVGGVTGAGTAKVITSAVVRNATTIDEDYEERRLRGDNSLHLHKT
eukprot:Tbor_TRINITY_DN4092_c0_g1::TRINITY_DN4092_c0_g1_i1::g.11840::m.11840